MLDSSKLETGREIAERVSQGAEGDRRDSFGAASSSGVPDLALRQADSSRSTRARPCEARPVTAPTS
jgi:hypothetical protein